MLINIILPLASILITHGALDQSELVQMKVIFKAKQKVHPLYRLGDGKNAIRFRGNVIHGRFTDVVCIEPGEKGTHFGSWFINNVIKVARVPTESDSQQIEFEVHYSNVGPSDLYPMGYSFWRAK